jgi:site-specific DNA-methyltransferase (adenine-specific)
MSVILGDCLEELPKITNECAQIIICDPPYNIGKNFGNNKCKMNIDEYVLWCKKWINECLRILKKDGTMFVYGFSETLAELVKVIPENVNKKWIVWHYTNKTVPTLNFWQRSHESILVLWKDSKIFNRDLVRVPYTDNYKKASGKTRANTIGRFSSGDKTSVYNVHELGALPRDVIKIASLAGGGSERVAHPTQKPLELCETLINSCKQKEGIVVIPFAGSGSECVISKKHNLDFIGIEMNKEYIDIINKRLADTGIENRSNDIFSCLNWKTKDSYTKFKKSITQYEYYQQNMSSSEVLDLVKLDSKTFGSICENIITEILQLSKRTSTQNDGTKDGVKFEIKTGRFLKGTDDCMWQHIEPDYDYDYLLCCLLNFDKFDVYYISKNTVIELIKTEIIKKQGKQGYICKKSNMEPYLTKIEKLEDLPTC